MVESRTIGLIWFTSVFASWVYYTVWILISPCIDSNHYLQRFFPERKWGIVIPILLGIGFLSIALTFIGIALINDSKIYDEVTRKIEEKQHNNMNKEQNGMSNYRFKKFNAAHSSAQLLQKQSSFQA